MREHQVAAGLFADCGQLQVMARRDHGGDIAALVFEQQGLGQTVSGNVRRLGSGHAAEGVGVADDVVLGILAAQAVCERARQGHGCSSGQGYAYSYPCVPNIVPGAVPNGSRSALHR
ncbi:hypothetical protein D3C72_1855330 [compost metagenome]